MAVADDLEDLVEEELPYAFDVPGLVCSDALELDGPVLLKFGLGGFPGLAVSCTDIFAP